MMGFLLVSEMSLGLHQSLLTVSPVDAVTLASAMYFL